MYETITTGGEDHRLPCTSPRRTSSLRRLLLVTKTPNRPTSTRNGGHAGSS